MLKDYLRYTAKQLFNSKPRPFIEFAIEEIEKKWNERNFFVIEAPTGYGKTTISATIALKSIVEDFKCIIAFPLRTLLEDQFQKFRKLLSHEADEIIGKRYMHNPDSKFLIKPITLTTVDTLALNLFGLSPEDLENVIRDLSFGHYFFGISSVVFSNIILDEVHLLADSTKSLSFLASLIKIAESFDQKVFLISATLPIALKQKLKEISENMDFISFERSYDPDFYSERLNKSYEIRIEKLGEDKFEKILGWIKESDFSNALVIFNTVDEAGNFYRKLKDSGFNALLLHSRFTEEDREEKTKKLKKTSGCVFVTTQVVEAGVDISSDLLITDIAPASSLIQRFGRFLRYEEKEGKIFVWFEESKGNFYKVYSRDLVEKTLSWLKENANNLKVHLPRVENAFGYAEMINSVYCSEDFRVDKSIVEDFEEIFLHLENLSKKAKELLFEMEGSFVREGFQVPISFVRETRDISEFFRKFVIPINFEFFMKMKPKVLGAFVEEKGDLKLIPKAEIDFIDKFINQRKFFEQMIKRKILAFAIDVSYDSELGLIWHDNRETRPNA